MTDQQNVEYMLTTVDNPYNPWTEWDDWYAWDTMSGYHTASFLARVAVLPDDLTEHEVLKAIDEAIDQIVAENVSGMFKKIAKPSEIQKEK